MKKLTIVRHAKSSWEYDLKDTERPLKKRGRSDIALVAEDFKKKFKNPEIIYSSPAVRAMETCKIFMDKTEYSHKKLNISEQLYDFGGNSLTQFVRSLDDNYTNVMVFGHNYAMTHFANYYGTIYIDNVPTSGLVVLEFDINHWKDLEPGKTISVIIPKPLRP